MYAHVAEVLREAGLHKLPEHGIELLARRTGEPLDRTSDTGAQAAVLSTLPLGVALWRRVAAAALAVPAWLLLRPLTVVIVIVPVPVMVPIPVVVVVVVMVAVPAAPIAVHVPVAVPDMITLCVWAGLAFVAILGADAQVLSEDLSDGVVFEVLARGFPGLAVAVVHCGLPGQLPDCRVPLDHAGQCTAEALHVLVDVGEAPPYMLEMATSDEHSCVELRRLP
jgi:hypothetical protein